MIELLTALTIALTTLQHTLAKQIDMPELYSDPFIATVTAYSSSEDETDETPFLTASGTHTRPGIVACPRKYPFQTHFLIHDKEYICEDRLNSRYSDRFDIWLSSKVEARNFGIQELEVRVITRREAFHNQLTQR